MSHQVPLPSLYSTSLFTTLLARDRLAQRLTSPAAVNGRPSDSDCDPTPLVRGIHVHQRSSVTVDSGMPPSLRPSELSDMSEKGATTTGHDIGKAV